jgi:hypothetical protein
VSDESPTLSPDASSGDLAAQPPSDEVIEGAVPVVPPAPDDTQTPLTASKSLMTDRPELAVGGAFAGGLVLALILKRLAR